MVYITTKRKPSFHQMTMEEFLDDNYVYRPGSSDKTITYTLKYPNLPWRLIRDCPVGWYINRLRDFNTGTAYLRDIPRHELYETFYIPKSSGGMRRIDAPVDKLKIALTQLKGILENDFHMLYHTCAFAYIPHRCTLDAVKRHQANDSKWFGKFDLHDFFGSTTLDFVMSQLSKIYPFNLVVSYPDGEAELRKALELGFLNGGLPQGTPLSPTLTNIMMIPVDYELSKALREKFPKENFVYTRYADDFHISSRRTFNVMAVQKTILEVLSQFGAPFSLNEKKTRYGSRNGKNWMLGVMLNGENNITIGRKKDRQFRAALTNFARDYLKGETWDADQIMYVLGLYSYYVSVEGDVIVKKVEQIDQKYGVNTIGTMKQILAS